MRCFRQSLRAHTLTLEALESRKLLAATPQLLADINPQSSGHLGGFTEFNGRMYYTAMDAERGSELWSSDGTPEGTHLVKDINPGSTGSVSGGFTVAGGYLYFSAITSGTTSELWRTDGTEAGTQPVLGNGGTTAIRLPVLHEIVAFNDAVYFTAATSNGSALWKSDGTVAGTVAAGASATNIHSMTVVDDELFFITGRGSEAKTLRKIDGTPSGTKLVKEFGTTGLSDTPLLTSFDGALYFRANDATSTDALWKSDGTPAGTVKLASGDNHFLKGTKSLTVAGDRLYFAASTAATGSELWSTDGTVAGTQLVADLAPGSASFSPEDLFAVGERLYFNGRRNGKQELWNLESGTSSTLRLATLEKNDLPLDVRAMAEYQGDVYFTTYSDVFGADLWRTDGTEMGTLPWRSQIASAGSVSSLFEMGTAADRLFFKGNVGGTGLELWSSDGTYGGTGLVIDLTNSFTDSSNPQNFVTAGDFVYFTANDGTGTHLFSTPGPNGPVTRLTTSAFEMQSAAVEQIVPVGNQLYFVARDANGRQYLGVTSGTQQTTQSLAWPFDANQIEIEGLREFESGVMFLAHDVTLGTLVGKAGAGGIELVATLGPGWSVPAQPEAVVAQGFYYFVAEGVASELWRSDGTAAGTWRVRDAVPTLGLNPTQLTATESSLYFVSKDATPTLWKTDGTPEGTLEFVGTPVPDKLIAAGDKVYFQAPGAVFTPLWVSDGTLAGTKLLTHMFGNVSAFRESRSGSAAAAFGDDLYFVTLSDSGPAYRLVKTDGTTEGTSTVIALNSLSAFGVDMAALGDKIYVYTGLTLLEVDGVSGVTQALLIPLPIPHFRAPLKTSLAPLGDVLYFSNADFHFQFGYEPHTLTPAPSIIVGRHLHYNNSVFDDYTVLGHSELDDLAIATDKSPYFAGDGLATFDSISSYSRGINGIVIDIAGLTPNGLFGNLSAKDFQFRIGATNDPSSWTTAPAPQAISTVERSDENGAFTRIYLTWAEGAIKNTWLEITVLANARTGLDGPDVFYFGSRIGDTGLNTPAGSFTTTAADELAARSNTAPQQAVTSLYDFNRDGNVTSADQLIARSNAGLTRRLNLPGPLVAAALVEKDGDSDGAIASALAVSAASTESIAAPLVSAQVIPPPLRSAPLPAVVATGAEREVPQDRGISRAFAQQWLKLASDSLEDVPLEDTLLNLLTTARARRGVRG